MKVQIETITPGRAKKDLAEANGGNFRRISKPRVDRYSRDMRDGVWKLNGEAIKYDSTGHLIDGQHRLTACVESGVSIESLVVYGVDDYVGGDEGQPRNLTQWLTHFGYKNTFRLAAIVGNTLSIESGTWGKGSNSSSYRSVHECLRWFDEHKPALIQACDIAGQCKVGGTAIGSVVFAGTRNHSLPLNSEIARYFSSKMASGAELANDDPVHVLRERLLEDKGSQIKMSAVVKRAICIQAWNKTCAGESCSLLRFRVTGPAAMKFPEIVQAEM